MRRAPPPPETRVQFASLSPFDPVKENPLPAVRAVETSDKCLVLESCIDDYLWSRYERTLKVDTNKVTERVKATVKKNGKPRTVTKTISKYVLADFTWKDPAAAEKAGMSLKDYVIGGMDRSFRVKLYHALLAMDEAGLMPGITSAFRDNYRQAIASGHKAAADRSYHGGIGRPYRDRDPPHVGPSDGKEFVAKRGGAKVQNGALQIDNAQKVRLQATAAKKALLQAKNAPSTAPTK